jgi:outer membrane protein assembly factor BamB
VDDGGHAAAAVYALEPQTGRIIWRREMANSVKNRLLRVTDVLVALDAEGRLSALDPATGACKWTCALPFTHVVINTAPVASPDGKTVVFGLVHHLAAVDARTGAVKWCVAHGGTEGVPQRFAVDGARVYGISSWDGIYAYALSDGRLAWKIKDRGACVYPGADLLLADGSLYAFLHRTIREIDPEKGTEKRKVQLPAAYNFGVASGAVHVTPSRFVVGTAASGCVAIDRARLAPLWKTDFSPALVTTTPYTGASLPAGNVSPVRVAPNVLCAPAADGAVHFFREDDGRALSRETCGVPYLAGAALTEQGLVVVADMGGFVRAYRPPAGKKEKA